MASAAIVLRDAAGEVEQIPRRTMIVAARAVKEQARTYAAGDVGADLRMSGFGKRGARLTVRDTITGHGAYATCVITPRPAGPWAILDEGAAKHVVGAGKRRGKRRVMVGPFGPFTGPTDPNKPISSPARGTWKRVQRWAEREVPRIFAEAVGRAVD